MKLNDRKLYDVQFDWNELEALEGAERAQLQKLLPYSAPRERWSRLKRANASFCPN